MNHKATDRRIKRGGVLTVVLALLWSAVLTASPAALADPATVAIDVGGPGDATFLADSYGTGGLTDAKPATRPSLPNWSGTVTHPIPATIWHTARHLESGYTVPDLAPGSYEVRLYFMDWYFTRPGERVFDVAVNGDKVLTDFDIIGTAVTRGADGQAAFGVERDFPVTVDSSGTVTIDLVRGSVNQPQINTIVITPSTSRCPVPAGKTDFPYVKEVR